MIQSVVLLLVGCSGVQFFLNFYAMSGQLREDAQWLYLSMLVVFSLKLMVGMYPGILTAQNRFHWVPLFQASSAWLRLLVLAVCLFSGLGIMAYVIVELLVVIFTYLYYKKVVGFDGVKFEWDSSGFCLQNYKKLFSYSGSLVSGVCWANGGVIIAAHGHW